MVSIRPLEMGRIDCRVVAHTFNPSTQKARGRWISGFKVSLVYRMEFQDSQDYTEKHHLERNGLG